MAPKKPRVGRIQDDTPIMPWIVADAVISEVEVCYPLGMTRAEERVISDKLADKANAVYQHNEQFRRSIRAKGNRGRDQLYVWMRHWLSAELHRVRPDVFRKLPRSFANGQPLVCYSRRGR